MGTRTLLEVGVGDQLPALTIMITPTTIVAGALASRDYQDVHHDPERARRRGSPDIFMNILTTNGLVGRYVTDWTGPGGLLRSVRIRLGVPNYPGDAMVLTGSVTAVGEREPGGERGTVTVAVRGANGRGDHVTGTVTVSLPTAPAQGAGIAASRPAGEGR